MRDYDITIFNDENKAITYFMNIKQIKIIKLMICIKNTNPGSQQ